MNEWCFFIRKEKKKYNLGVNTPVRVQPFNFNKIIRVKMMPTFERERQRPRDLLDSAKTDTDKDESEVSKNEYKF